MGTNQQPLKGINVLIVAEDRLRRDELKRFLANHGAPEAVAAQDRESALEILGERDVEDVRERIHVLLTALKIRKTHGAEGVPLAGEGIELARSAKTELQSPPFVAAMTEPDETASDQTAPIDAQIRIETPLNEADLLRLLDDQALAFLKTHYHYPGTEGDNLVENVQGALVAVLDLDGTLSRGFTMGRFVKDLAAQDHELHHRFLEILSGLPPDRRAENARALEKLLRLFEAYEKEEYRGTYTEFVTEHADLYALMVKGLKKTDMMELGNSWAKTDASQHLHSYSQPLIRMMTHLGIVSTLVTGTPEEVVAGYRETLGIQEQCHPMVLHTDPEGRYTGAVKYYTGLHKSKNRVTELMAERGNRVLLAFGDQETDYSLFDAALGDARDGIHGLSFYMGTQRESLTAAYSGPFGDRRLLRITPELRTSAILEMVVERLHAAIQWERNREAISGEVRSRIETLIGQRSRIREFAD